MQITKRLLTAIMILAMVFTLATPVTAQAKSAPKLNKTKISLNVNKSYQLEITGASKKAKWKSSNKKVAVVSKNGKVTGKKKGTAVIKAKAGKKTLKCKVIVRAKAPAKAQTKSPTKTQANTPTKVKLNKTKISLDIGKTKKFQLKVKGTSKKATWKSDNKKVATVSQTGMVTAKKKGTAVIAAKVGKNTLKCKVTVNDTHKHHWVAHDDPQPENIFGVVCTYCWKVFNNTEDWKAHQWEAYMQEVRESGAIKEDGSTDYDLLATIPMRHASWAGAKTVYRSWLWHFDCDICGFHDYDDAYYHPIDAVICSGCKKEFKDEDAWKAHFMENSMNGDESHKNFTVRINQ